VIYSLLQSIHSDLQSIQKKEKDDEELGVDEKPLG